jgi:hypothetical protein
MAVEHVKRTRSTFIAGALLLVAAGLAAGWKTLSDRQPVSADEAAVIVEQGELMTQQLQEQLNEQLASQPVNAEQERIDSPRGQALLRKCLEWTEFHDNHPDESSLQHRDTACGNYSAYIESGAVAD